MPRQNKNKARAKSKGSEFEQPPNDPTEATAGAWKKLLECEVFERDNLTSRLRQACPSPFNK
jgi:hypothetical protein